MVDHGELWAVKDGIVSPLQDLGGGLGLTPVGQPIDKRDTYATLLPRLANIGGDLLLKTLHEIRAETVRFPSPVPTAHLTPPP